MKLPKHASILGLTLLVGLALSGCGQDGTSADAVRANQEAARAQVPPGLGKVPADKLPAGGMMRGGGGGARGTPGKGG